MEKVKLIFGTYNSQPAGSDDYQFEKAYQEAYKPFLTVLYNFPKTRVVLHYSGILLEWFEKNHPEFLMLLNEMVKRRQVELLGSGYYDPILPMIPNADRIGQIELLTTYIRKNFGKRPRGSWVTQQVWDPSLAYMFASSGMDYLFLDDHHFFNAGGTEEGLYEPCITEDQGKIITVFPVLQKFNDRIPREGPREMIEKLLSAGGKNTPRVVTILEPGEKYGLYGESGKRCYQENWFESFFSILFDHEDTIEMVRPGSLLRYYVPKKKFYFNCTPFHNTKYDESLYFRQVLSKYYESNMLYSKMIYTNILVNQIRGDKYRKKTAREELWKGQCNNAYWHGNPHGIYSNHLRKAAYHSLIEAEKVTHEKGIFIPSVISVDFDMDGRKEYLYQGNELNAYIHERGGVLFELDFLPKSWNYLDSMSRYLEKYYKEFSLSNVRIDEYPRKAFIDHFFSTSEKIETFDRIEHDEKGDFIHSVYEVTEFEREKKHVTLRCEGAVRGETKTVPAAVEKKYSFNKNKIDVEYSVTNLGETELRTVFGTECNLSFAAKGMESHRVYNTSKQKTVELGIDLTTVRDVKEITVDDVTNNVSIKIEAGVPGELWILPIETNSLGEAGMETMYQSTCFIPRWELKLEQGESWSNSISIIFTEMG
jgi:4-alpha-glucanotransferase